MQCLSVESYESDRVLGGHVLFLPKLSAKRKLCFAKCKAWKQKHIGASAWVLDTSAAFRDELELGTGLETILAARYQATARVTDQMLHICLSETMGIEQTCVKECIQPVHVLQGSI